MMDWPMAKKNAAIAHVTGLVNQELLLQNEYLVAENRILKARIDCGCQTARRPRWQRSPNDWVCALRP
jgi:hypothetical protein